MANRNIQMRIKNGAVWDNLYPNTKAILVEQDPNNRFVTDAEKATWNAKQNALGFTPVDAASKNQANGVAALDSNGKLNPDTLPPLAISETYDCADQAAMLAIGAQIGDIAIRFDLSKTFICVSSPSNVVGAWKELRTPTDTVSSVAGKTGTVILVKNDVGLGNVDNTADMDKPISTAMIAALDGKADDVLATGSVNGQMSATDKAKLDGIQENANNYSHPGSHPASMITEDSTRRFVSDAQITGWNNKASTAVATTTTAGLMSSNDKTKLDSVEAGANNYSHPGTHPATMITEDANHRFVTEVEINAWNAKQDALGFVPVDVANSNKAAGYVKITANNTLPEGYTTNYQECSSESQMLSLSVKKGDFVWRSDQALLYICDTTPSGATTVENFTQMSSPVMTVAGRTGAVVLSKSDVGLGNVDNTSDANKPISTAVQAALNTKAGLSAATITTNGLMSAADKTKLDSIDENATAYVHPATHGASMIDQDATHRFVTDVQISTWNAKATTDVATVSAAGLMSTTDKIKLNGIEAGANNYTHPASHSPSIITQDAMNRFVTDAEKTAWGAKADIHIGAEAPTVDTAIWYEVIG